MLSINPVWRDRLHTSVIAPIAHRYIPLVAAISILVLVLRPEMPASMAKLGCGLVAIGLGCHWGYEFCHRNRTR